MKILVINAGSSSLKYQLIDMEAETMLAKGNCERIGIEGGIFTHKAADGRAKGRQGGIPDHIAAFRLVTEALTDKQAGVIRDLSEITAIGHRIVQGGAIFNKSLYVNDEVIEEIRSLIPLAPLHNAPELQAIFACREVFGKDVPQCVVFDTAFHSTMPEKAYMFAIPYEYYKKYKVRRYGAHGTSHRYVSKRCSHLMHQPLEDINMITCHIGNGSSITAIKGGTVLDTSMGLTPLGGFMMGTRSGSLDPSVITFLMKHEDISSEEMDNILNRKSGMMGICGHSDDRDVTRAEVAGDRLAQLAHEMLYYQITKYIGAYTAAMGGVDAIVFTAGLGENVAHMRYAICRSLKYLGLKLDPVQNDEMVGGKEGKISSFDSQVAVYVIPTNEELMIARDTKEIVEKLAYATTEDKTVVDLEDV